MIIRRVLLTVAACVLYGWIFGSRHDHRTTCYLGMPIPLAQEIAAKGRASGVRGAKFRCGTGTK